jgi:hypothetical protein
VTTYTPPDVPSDVPVLDHIFATMRAISSWNRQSPRFQKIIMPRHLIEDMVIEANLRSGRPTESHYDGVFGMRIEPVKSDARSYTITYEVL